MSDENRSDGKKPEEGIARRRFLTGGLRPTIRLFLPGPRLPVISGGRILAGKTYRDDFRTGNLAGSIQPLDKNLSVRNLPSEVSVEEVPLDALT